MSSPHASEHITFAPDAAKNLYLRASITHRIENKPAGEMMPEDREQLNAQAAFSHYLTTEPGFVGALARDLSSREIGSLLLDTMAVVASGSHKLEAVFIGQAEQGQTDVFVYQFKNEPDMQAYQAGLSKILSSCQSMVMKETQGGVSDPAKSKALNFALSALGYLPFSSGAEVERIITLGKNAEEAQPHQYLESFNLPTIPIVLPPKSAPAQSQIRVSG